jgi:HD-GYP domain-containing protein (c-di-GMP phosphodiesterase class II)
MPHPILLLAASAVAAALITSERRRRQGAERLAASTLETLLNAIEANDEQTGQHVRRVAQYSLILADAIGASHHQRHTIERVALFHDIGKIHEALFDIVHDSDTLDPAERQEVATHPQRGADVLQPLTEFYPELSGGVLTHHERWDGTGYPRGIAAHHIPLAARIVAIADTFDAVSHGRRYRSGGGVQAARQVIADGGGTQFDPRLVTTFLRPHVFARIAAAHDRGIPRAGNRLQHGPGDQDQDTVDRERKAPTARTAAGANNKRSDRSERRDRDDRAPTTAPDISFRWRG